MSKNVRSNSAAFNIVSDADIRKQASLAFSDKANSDALAGSAVQRLAYAVTAEHFTMVQAKKDIAPLADTLASPEALKAVRDAMTEFFIPALDKQEEGKDDKSETAKVTRVSQVQLLSRAIQLAAIFAKVRVGLDAFNATTGTFMVPTSLLLAKDETAFGRLASSKTVALDSRPILVSGKNRSGDDAVLTLRASVARLVLVNAPPKARTTKTPESVGLDKHASEVARILTADTATVALADLSDTLKNSISAIVQWWDAQNRAAAAKDNSNKPKAA